MNLYGLSQLSRAPMTLGRTFIVSSSSGASYQGILSTWVPDAAGNSRNFTTVTDALAICTSGRGDVIILAADFTAPLTAAELLSAETKGVTIIAATPMVEGRNAAYRAAALLPATTQAPIFTATGKLRLYTILGEAMTLFPATANTLKITANPTIGADVDLSGATSVANAAVGTQLSITGTFANGLVVTPSGALVHQAASTIILPGTIDLVTTGTSATGTAKWMALYSPIDQGARLIAA